VKVVLNGVEGFLGWHTRCRLKTIEGHAVILVGGRRFRELAAPTDGAYAIIHPAGVNRAPSTELHDGNIAFAKAVEEADLSSARPPRTVSAKSAQVSYDSSCSCEKRGGADDLKNVSADLLTLWRSDETCASGDSDTTPHSVADCEAAAER
jgi:UDP-2-acetamido-2,6-beta-L-arabino-hexul-4-ose reductase